ncbi:MAG TPA: hypothetical protein VK841_03945 [Polyangiaceae bacterium]|nr:hypothetical protein [Polyangiaceae bacterium]
MDPERLSSDETSPDARPPAAAPDEGERSSVTDVNGSVAHFEMTYSPPAGGRTKFGPPFRTRIPSTAYLAAALVLGGVVAYAYDAAPSSSWIFGWVVEGDRGRPVSAQVLAIVIVISAVGTVLRTHMRGVLVSEEWIEARYLLPFGIPRSRRWAWPQINRIVMDGHRVGLELWDGSFEHLPPVGRGRELSQLIMQHAYRRKIDVTVLAPTPV